MNTDHRETWPVCYRDQREAGIPPGDFAEPRRKPVALFITGIAVGLLLIGPAIIDIVEALQ